MGATPFLIHCHWPPKFLWRNRGPCGAAEGPASLGTAGHYCGGATAGADRFGIDHIDVGKFHHDLTVWNHDWIEGNHLLAARFRVVNSYNLPRLMLLLEFFLKCFSGRRNSRVYEESD